MANQTSRSAAKDEVGVYINNGTGGLKRFVALGEADTPAFGNWIVIADVNGDGIPDDRVRGVCQRGRVPRPGLDNVRGTFLQSGRVTLRRDYMR